ncbi:MAG: cupin domain-containing protein [Desulfobacterales bacterium]|nr:cupin domain-containing protein [Desulfobacterales bacterium]
MEELIQRYGLLPHPEGGYFKEIYRSQLTLASPETGSARQAVTQIYFLLTRGQVSRFHRVVHDEIWHFYEGDPLTLIQFDGRQVQETTIGKGGAYVSVVPGKVWQAAETTGAYTLVGCTVAPGVDFEDFSFMSDSPETATAFAAGHGEYSRFI